MPKPARLSRTFTLAWLMSLAFTKSKARAVVSYPLCLLVVAVYAPRGQVYEAQDGNGMVIFGPYRLWMELFSATLIFVAMIVVGLALIPVLGPIAVGALAWAISVLIALGALQMGSGAMATTPVGSETPKGDRWQVAALAQRPGTELSALLLTKRLMDSLPPNAVAVAAAADDRLLNTYEKFGFTRGRAKRVHLLVRPLM